VLIKTRSSQYVRESEVTDETVFHNRRRLLKQMGFIGLGAMLSRHLSAGLFDGFTEPALVSTSFKSYPLHFTTAVDAERQVLTSESKATSHNNFYEFGAGKNDPSENAQQFKVNPWNMVIDGAVAHPLELHYEDLFRFNLEERIYRLRCVEAWSMVIPWVGFPLAALLEKAEPQAGAKFVAFQTLHDPEVMPGQRGRFLGGGLRYPYVEGLRLDEATHPLTILAVGVYGKTLPPQNGAPIRLVVPWKYGFKSIKSIVRITVVDKQPPTTWGLAAPHEYGFYANVNPKVAHPRWSQASERRITTSGLGSDKRIPTALFNGYADQVAGLYKGMDLARFF